jgi:hypothetical protein
MISWFEVERVVKSTFTTPTSKTFLTIHIEEEWSRARRIFKKISEMSVSRYKGDDITH